MGQKVFVALLVVLVIAVIGIGAMFMYSTAHPLGSGGSGGQIEVVNKDCQTNPTLTITGADAADKGTAVTLGAINGKINGVETTISSGTTSTAKDASLELLLNASGYIDTIVTGEKVNGCTPFNKEFLLKPYQALTVSVKNDADTAVLTDNAAGGAQNETAMTAGSSKTWTLELTGNDKKYSGDMVYVVELGDATNVSSISVTDANGNAMVRLGEVPSVTTVSGTNQYRAAFELPEKYGTGKVTYFVTPTLKSGKTLSAAAVYSTIYVKQAFKDTDGSYKVGIQDASGTAKYIASYDYDWYIA